MDILSHGLWGGITLGRKNKKDFWWAFVIGLAPDLLSFGIFTLMIILGLATGPDWSLGPPPEGSIPKYVHSLYEVTHSFIIFAIVFFVVWLIRKKPFLPLLAWALHISMDIPTHSTEFFPTPFLWPFFDNIRVNGIPWSHPIIAIPNATLLIILYFWVFVVKKRLKVKK